MSTNSRSIHGTALLVGIGALILGGPTSPAAAQTVEVTTAPARFDVAPVRVRYDDRTLVWDSPQAQDVPQDVRIMRTIVSTALSQVEAPEVPKELTGDSAADERTKVLDERERAVVAVTGGSFFRRGDVSGFYMKGYGYLFTVSWQVSPMAVFNSRAAGRALEARLLGEEARSGPATQWADQYRQRLSNALRDVIAGYGSTLRRAGAGESITFIADFGGGDEQTVTMTVKADALHGSNVEANRGAIQVSTGQAGTSERMRTQLKIMSQIIDTSLHPESTEGGIYVSNFGTYYGGSAEAQNVPGYGVIFRKNARLNTSRTFVGLSGQSRFRVTVDSVKAEATKTYRAHLDTLRLKTAEVLATYGPTLTELKDDDWVGIYFDVGSAAALLGGGMDNYLVQARMRDIRQAANQSDPAAWLRGRLVTNEKEE